jgi:hypothetical protein
MRFLPERSSVLRLALPLVFLVGVAGALYLAAKPVAHLVVPAHALSAYHQVQADDLKTIVRRKRGGENEFTSPQDLVGRYALVALPADQPVSERSVGPRLAGGALDHVFIIGVSLASGAGTNRAIEPGRQVQIVFSAIGGPAPIEGVWILSKSQDGTSAVLALPTDRLNDFAANSPKGYLIGTSLDTLPRPNRLLPVRRKTSTKPGRKCPESLRVR